MKFKLKGTLTDQGRKHPFEGTLELDEFEYLVEVLPILISNRQARLNVLAGQGWLLLGIHSRDAYFARPKP